MPLSQVVGRLIGVREHVVDPGGGGASRVPRPTTAVVVGGGIAGMSAAVVLVERGVKVTVLEAAPTLGGRLGAWPEALADGTQRNEHGFHAVFRQYYNWRSILRRVDPGLGFLRPVPGYPILSEQWPTEEFGRLPPAPPANLLALLLRSPSLRLADLRAMDRDAALPLLSYDPVRTYAEFDRMTADELLASLRLPDRARAMLFEVFSHSFFNHEAEMSAAEMIAQFHFYLLGNPEGLAFDCPDEDYATAIWEPLTRHVEKHGGRVVTGVAAARLDRQPGGWRVTAADGSSYPAGHVVLAVDPPALAALVAGSPGLTAAAPQLVARMPAFGPPGPPYAVARYWMDGDVHPDRAVFSGVSRQPTLDSVTLYHRLEHEPRRWAERTGGSVVELHAYACEPDVPADELAERMRVELTRLWPEAAGLRVRELRARVEAQAPAFTPGGHAQRPGVRTDAAGLYLAGDGIRTDFPSALMERSAATGIIAANHILRSEGGAAEPVRSIRPRGLLAGRR
ncbi:FAD-dependent oxidoreductase [Micromonospora sp. 4G57]|uniref:FAD-dependent oxidoreductase n=1 Tax=Micromonospora sicca TaxID=2202420 RepID=A0ABU5JIX3_9ACTN|nr:MULTISPECIES: FAD-dependent oxidoreductase [unclassified Micromonospora]MDZ5441307.1 FAD-dependent oxidoreductase [Micromonospora sp. 4G57]MDZ5492582.1 FAD-dependent oxidoreductase [Micromonospora sp. 4G53]